MLSGLWLGWGEVTALGRGELRGAGEEPRADQKQGCLLSGLVQRKLAPALCGWGHKEVRGWQLNPTQELGEGKVWSLDKPGSEVNWP